MRASVALALLLAISGLESFEGRKLRRNSPGCSDENLSATLVDDAVCNPEYGQPLVDKFLQCGDEESAEDYITSCGKSADGEICSLFRYIQLLVSNSCFGPAGCTSDCRSALESYRDDMRCCLTATRNVSNFNGIWEDCGLERPVFCNDSTLNLSPVENPQSCGDGFEQRVLYTDFYCAAAGQSIVDTLTECSNDDDAKYFVNICGTNEHGVQCLDIVFSGSGNAVPDLQCNSVVDSCPADCSASLESFRDRYGCCADPAITELFPTDVDLWSLCNVEAPGVCSDSALVFHSVTKPEPLSGGAIAGIAIGAVSAAVLVLVGVVVCVVVIYSKRRGKLATTGTTSLATPLLSSGPEDKSPLGSELPPVTESPHDQHLKKTDTDSPHDPHVKKTVIQQGQVMINPPIEETAPLPTSASDLYISFTITCV